MLCLREPSFMPRVFSKEQLVWLMCRVWMPRILPWQLMSKAMKTSLLCWRTEHEAIKKLRSTNHTPYSHRLLMEKCCIYIQLHKSLVWFSP
ncbi:hypothetical protein MANES_06G036233v8 [Manihot esculenta]|uniref:Uncharacterized protein n=1 Tax=Manihot esculenta TaxID=3983 RepID=A0ACB7HIZ9_MANES|nr:hypothetical protein MANES_06G036233v8 [Manihot esculenta]